MIAVIALVSLTTLLRPKEAPLMGITVRNVSKRFGDFVALDDITVEIPSGVADRAARAERRRQVDAAADHRRARAARRRHGRDRRRRRHRDSRRSDRNVGFVFQHYAAFKHMTVYKNVAFGLRDPQAAARTRSASGSRELLELVHLEQFADRYPAQLSGGQRQRMALARALAVEPEVLLLDEPFGALDAQVRKELRAGCGGCTTRSTSRRVFVTHDQEEAIEVADTIVVIAGGSVEQVGTPDELYDDPANDFVMSFLGPVTRLGGQLVRPHDLEIILNPTGTTVTGHVLRIVRLGFEVRIDVETDDGEVWVQLTRGEADRLGLEPDLSVGIRAIHPLTAAAAAAPAPTG